MAANFYGAIALIGGGTGALDKIDGADLADGDGAMVMTNGTAYLYWLDADSGAAESSPDVISPDSNAGNKRWLLQALRSQSGITDKHTVTIDHAAVADNDYAKFTVNGLEGRSYVEIKQDLDLEIGTDIVAKDAPVHTGQATIPTIDLTSGQIAFPATAVPSAEANTLDDYEEGSWTPDLEFGGAKVGITYSEQTGYYTKIGNRVSFEGKIILTSKGSSSGNAECAGLPFTVGAAIQANIADPLIMLGLTAGGAILVICSGTSVWLALQTTTDRVLLTEANFSDTSQIRFCGVYKI